jgi:hypothetical protein
MLHWPAKGEEKLVYSVMWESAKCNEIQRPVGKAPLPQEGGRSIAK